MDRRTIKRELKSLTDRLASEAKYRSDAIQGLSKNLEDLTRSLGKKIEEVSAVASDGQSTLNQKLKDETKRIVEEFSLKATDLSSALESKLKELHSKKADRSAVADLLSDMAKRLTGED